MYILKVIQVYSFGLYLNSQELKPDSLTVCLPHNPLLFFTRKITNLDALLDTAHAHGNKKQRLDGIHNNVEDTDFSKQKVFSITSLQPSNDPQLL
ncbi:hypothetical protein L596_002138 [Steinernema carpocapsae]|uniref:Uncharacterized protein n=1 Tax=Steinernema carpocapsae TaxID=34508 RepID=A0A4U8UNP5_STECR|nr:hypothetical protein L596_002138 [Steinernema carpocapsae]